jgi:hypothetical protein
MLLKGTLAILLLLASSPAGATTSAKLFTIDGNGNRINEIDGSDDVAFSFAGTNDWVSGTIRAVDILDIDKTALQESIDTYVDFTGGEFTGGDLTIDFQTVDVLIFDIVLDSDSGYVDLITASVTTDPLGLDPVGAGFFTGCDPGLPVGCAHNVPGGGEPPFRFDDILLANGGFVSWEYMRNLMAHPAAVDTPPQVPDMVGGAPMHELPGHLGSGEISRRLFIAWEDTGPQSPLSKDGQLATFTISSGGLSTTLSTPIVPEPGTAALLGMGLAGLAAIGRKRA